ncbi:MAG: two-component system response regulator [Actinomycetota bacterium]
MTPKRRVVVAEDEAVIRLDLTSLLEDSGYEVVAAVTDGQAAIEAVEELRPDLVLMDVAMPVLDGVTAASKITERRLCPVVMVTAYSQVELVERAADAGAMGYLVKPVSPTSLLPSIEVAIARFEQLNQLATEIETVTERLEVRKVVDRAKGLLMSRLGIDEPAAFRWLQKAAMDNRSSMKAVSQGVIDQMGPTGQ